ncbi:MAG: VanW family protein [Acidimicrobiales bacterium]
MLGPLGRAIRRLGGTGPRLGGTGRRLVRLLLSILAVAAGALVLVTAAWAVDLGTHHGRVPRNVSLAGRSIGGFGRARLARVVEEVSREEESGTVTVRAPQGSFSLPASELDLRVDRSRTEDIALGTGRRGLIPGRVWRWALGFLHPIRVRVHRSADRDAAYRAVAAHDPGPRTPPTEPSIALRSGHLVAVPGRAGRGISPADVLAALSRAPARRGGLVIDVGRGPVPPLASTLDAARLAEHANEITSAPLPVHAGTANAMVSPTMLRQWLRAQPGDATPGAAPAPLVLGIDPAAAKADLASLLAGAGTAPVDARFTVVGGAVEIIPSRDGTACCAPEAATLVLSALQSRASDPAPLTLPLEVVHPHRDDTRARALGINTVVSTFTTPHMPGEPRVQNIHRIADLVRGVVIEPGETFSVNQFVGRRTVAKGFVDAPTIGEHNMASHDVGGGVSQFGTTTFNAAFFDGLDIVEYQMHSVYISRYPYGREATLNYPHPDLAIRNNSPYGILIWTSYTDTSLTVTFYSTPWVQVQQSGQIKTPRGPCAAVTTERTRRRLSDGHVDVDHFYAYYSPQEGLDCPH